MTNQNRALSSFSDGEVDRSDGAGYERDEGRFVALADDPQHPVTPLDGHFFNVGLQASLARGPFNPNSAGGAAWAVKALGGEEEPAQLSMVEARRSQGLTLGRPAYWAGKRPST